MIITLFQTQTSLSQCIIMSMTWPGWLQGIGESHCNILKTSWVWLKAWGFRGVRTTWEKLLRGQKQKERVREKGRQGLLFPALRGPAAVAFIVRMLQHDTELIQPLVNTATWGPVPSFCCQRNHVREMCLFCTLNTILAIMCTHTGYHRQLNAN